MKQIVAATNNQGKIRELKELLGGVFAVRSLKELGVDVDAEETGSTFYENARIKARATYEATKLPCIADDSGLCVDALFGAPGINSARYAGKHGDDASNRQKLLLELNGEKNRSAHFETAIVYYAGADKTYHAFGRVDGKILCREEGNGGFGYDCIFYCEELKKSFGLATDEEKNSVSHRFRAVESLLNELALRGETKE